MRNFIYLIATLFAICLFACKEKKSITNVGKYETITVNLKNMKDIDVSDRSRVKEIALEVTDNSLLTYIEQIEIKNNKLFIYDAHRVIVFDTEGHFLYDINHRGNGPGEYTNINSFFFEEDKICLYDNNLQILFVYDINNIFVESKKTTEMMASIYPIGNETYIGKKKYQGDNAQIPVLAVLDKDLKLSFDINNKYLTSGVGVYDYCYSYENNILYWEFLNDIIYTIKEAELVPKYYIDFQEFKIPEIEKKDKTIGEIINYINTSTSNYATGVRYVHEDSSNVRFIFMLDEGIYYAKYDKQTKETLLYHFYDSTKSQILDYFMKYNDGQIIISANSSEDIDSNPKLLFINEE
jgi:hypothetical protein